MFFPAVKMTLSIPNNCPVDEVKYYEMCLEGEARSYEIKVIKEVWVNRELILWKDGEMIEEGFAHPWLRERLYGSLKEKTKFVVKNFLRNAKRIKSPVLWCLDGYATGGYYHWVVEILPRLWMAKQYLDDANIIIAIPDYFFTKWTFGSDFFNLLEIDKFLILKNKKKYKIEKLILPTRAGDPFFRQHEPLVKGVEWLKGNALKVSNKQQGKRIYISRSRAKWRKVINEVAIYPILNKYGFELVCFEDYGMADQISICKNADVIMGLHGAGLSNLIFMNKGAKLIEIRPDNVYSMYNCFFTLCPHFEISYNYVLCQYALNPLKEDKRVDDHSVIVSKIVLDAKLALILS